MNQLVKLFTTVSNREFDAILASGLAMSLLATIWLPESIFGKLCLGLVLILASTRCWYLFRDGTIWRLGKQTDSSWLRAVLSVSVLTFVLSVLLFLFASSTGIYFGNRTTGFLDKSATHWLTVKLPTVGLQQFLLQWLLFPLLLNAFRKPGWAIGVTAVVFSLLHLPNPLLMGLTLVAGVFWISSSCGIGN